MSDLIIKSLHQVAQEEYNYISKIRSGEIIPSNTGRRYLNDALLGGTNNSDIILLAGLSSTGKSTEMLQIAYNLATLNKNNRVLFMSLEVPGRKLASKLLSKILQKEVKALYFDPALAHNKSNYDSFLNIPIDIIEVSYTVPVLKAVTDKYCNQYPNDRIHFIFDHTLLVRNSKGDTENETLMALSEFCNDTKNIGSRVYYLVSQLNSSLTDSKRLTTLNGQYPIQADIFGSKHLVHVANNVVIYINPNRLNLPNKFYGIHKLPFGVNLTTPNPIELIYAHSIKTRDGDLRIDPLINNLKHNTLTELDDVKFQTFKDKYKI